MKKLVPILTGLSLALFSCGGGGGDSTQTEQGNSNTVTTTSTPSTGNSNTMQTYKVVGFAIDDFIINGTVEVIDLSTGKILSKTSSSEKGLFDVKVPLDSAVLVKVKGGILDKDGNSQTTNDQKAFNKTLVALVDVPLVQGDKKIIVSPVSTALVAKALGISSEDFLNDKVDLTQVVNSIKDKEIITKTYEEYVNKLPTELQPIASNDTEVLYKEKIVARLVQKAGKPENLAKEVEDLKLDGDVGITEEVLHEIVQEVYQEVNAESSITSTPSTGSSSIVSASPTQKLNKQITIKVLDEEGRPVNQANVQVRILQKAKADNDLVELSKTSKTTNTGGYVSLNIQVPQNISNGILEITSVKNGFAKTIKSIEFSKEDNIPESLSIKLTPVEYQTVIDANNTQISKGKDNSKVTIYIVKNRKNKMRNIILNKLPITRGAEEKVTFKMDIPIDLINDTNKVKVEIANFDPSNKTDAEKMPSWKDSNGNRLASVAFDYVKLTNLDTGEPLKRSLNRANEDEPVTIVRLVKCSLLKGDSDTTKEGYQVPVYILKDGVWHYIGEGVVVKDYTGTTLKKASEVCSNGTKEEYIKITITNPDFSKPYINLDYPISTTTEVKESCALLRFVSSKDNKPIKGIWVSLWDDDSNEDFYWAEGVTNENGEVKIKTVYYYNNSTDNKAKIGFWNDFTSKWVTKDIELKECDSKTFDNVTVIVPSNLCEVRGRVLDENGNGTQVWISVATQDWSYYKNTQSDSQGLYSIQVPCNTPSYLYVKDQILKFNVNGTINDNETRDDGEKVVMNIKVHNMAPYPWIWTESAQYVDPEKIPVYIGVYDEEGDFPIEVRVQLLDNNINEVSSESISLSNKDEDKYYGETKIEIEPPTTGGIYTLNVIATDSKGHTRNLMDEAKKWNFELPQIQIIEGNNTPPTFENYDAYASGKIIYASMLASDIDKDLSNCTIKLYQGETEITPTENKTEIQSDNYSCEAYYKFIVPEKGNYTVTYIATDNRNNTISANKTVYSPGDLPLSKYSYVDKAFGLKAGDIVNMFFDFYDPDDEIHIDDISFTVNEDIISDNCSNEQNTNESITCYNYQTDNHGVWGYLTFVVPNDNETTYTLCVNATINGANTGTCEKVYKLDYIPEATLQINIRK
jgi:protocatechuate 3,4-dioxygenase beta subunit